MTSLTLGATEADTRRILRHTVEDCGYKSKCWISLYTASKQGYCTSSIGYRKFMIHRFSYEHFRGLIPAGFVVHHKCRIRNCLNPEHLDAVTQGDNVREFSKFLETSRTEPTNRELAQSDLIHVRQLRKRQSQHVANVQEAIEAYEAERGRRGVAFGFCFCGCDQRTNLSPSTCLTRGYIRNFPYRYLNAHDSRTGFGPEYLVEYRGFSTHCWIWQKSINPYGYGQMRHRGRTHGAHRVYYERSFGLISPKFQIDHLCRVRACVNPAHLEAVPPKTNIRRALLATRATE